MERPHHLGSRNHPSTGLGTAKRNPSTRALELSKGKSVNIYTDSAYAHGTVHVDGPQWIKRGFLTTKGTSVRHSTALKRRLEAVLLPTKVAIMKCQGHQRGDSHVAQGNDAADRAAKLAGGY